MSKFKIGDKVRFVTKNPRYHARHSAHGLTVDYVEANGDVIVSYDDDRVFDQIVHPGDITLTTTVQKGDKFRVNKDDYAGRYGNGDVFEAANVDEHGVDFFDSDGDYRYISRDHVAFVDDNGEPWDYDPRVLRIQVGKYYRTRDGRKVGPVTQNGYGLYGAPGFAKNEWYECGNCSPGHEYGRDLIAEWTDETTTNPAIVAKLDKGQPRPALRPFVHADIESASAEATRLATANPGVEFAVYECVSTAKQERTYDHEWQRQAAMGNKIAAIKELRAQTGLMLGGAKDAVEDWLRYNAA